MGTYLTSYFYLFMIWLLQSDAELVGNCTIKDKPHLQCTEYKFTGTNCSLLYLQTRFPGLYNSTQDFPGTPHSFEADLTYDTDFPKYTTCNLTFTPMQNVGIKYVKGFEITYVRSATATPTCFVFDMSKATWKGDVEDKLTVFRKKIGVLAPGMVYHFELYALPKPNPPGFDDYKQLWVQAFEKLNPSIAQKWQATISYEKFEAERRVAVSFNQPPLEFNFTQFNVNYRDSYGEISPARRINSTAFNITDLAPGNYSIRVQPYDPYYFTQENDKCLCRLNNLCEKCVTTITNPIEMKFVATPTPPTSPPTSAATWQVTTQENNLDGVKVGLAVLGVVVGVALATVAVYVYVCKCRGGDLYKMDETEDKGIENDGCSIVTVQFMRDMIKKNNVDANKRRCSKRLKLFLLYEEDHEYHRRVVNNFATYLQQHAQCDVMCAEWHLDTEWVQTNLKQADYIVIVNSAKAYMSYMDQFVVKDGVGLLNGRRGSASISSIRNKFLQEQQYDSIVMVYFEYTDEQFVIPDICPGYRYKLMKNFTEFLRHIHKIPCAEDLARYDLPVDPNHNLRPIGQQLVESIAAAGEYEKTLPRNVLTMQRMISKTSEDSRQDSGLPSEPRWPSGEQHLPSDAERQLLQYLDSTSQDVVTIYPQDVQIAEIQVPKPNPVLSRLQMGNPAEQYMNFTPSPNTAGSSQYEFDFLPPDDFDDFDALSKTQSEQMRYYNDRYQAFSKGNNSGGQEAETENTEVKGERQSGGYKKDVDLVLLKMNNEDVILSGIEVDDSVSLGGQSV